MYLAGFCKSTKHTQQFVKNKNQPSTRHSNKKKIAVELVGRSTEKCGFPTIKNVSIH
jgi:hypothetical protein